MLSRLGGGDPDCRAQQGISPEGDNDPDGDLDLEEVILYLQEQERHFSSGLLSLRNKSLSFLHVFWGLQIAYFFLFLNNIPLYGCTIIYVFHNNNKIAIKKLRY